MNPHHQACTRYCDFLVVDLQTVESLIEVRGMSTEVHRVSGMDFAGAHRDHRRVHPRVVVEHDADFLRFRRCDG